jgi:hypothetical protein
MLEKTIAKEGGFLGFFEISVTVPGDEIGSHKTNRNNRLGSRCNENGE